MHSFNENFPVGKFRKIKWTTYQTDPLQFLSLLPLGFSADEFFQPISALGSIHLCPETQKNISHEINKTKISRNYIIHQAPIKIWINILLYLFIRRKTELNKLVWYGGQTQEHLAQWANPFEVSAPILW